MEEKMLILKMLQEGKITTDEAVKLLEALEKTTPNPSQSSSQNPSGSRINEIKDELTAKLNEMKLDEKLNKFGEKATKLAEQFGEKAGKFAEQFGENINSEKVNTNSEKFSEEFSKRMESLGQDIVESASKFADTFTSQFGSLFDAGYEKYRYNSSFTYPISENSSIYLKTSNFSIKASFGDNPELVINLYANSSIPQLVIDEYFKTIVDGSSYRFSSDFPGRAWGRIELLVPKGIDILSLSTTNAKCEINDVTARQINCSTTNGKAILTRCVAEELEILTDNEKVILDDTTARTANIRTSNSKIVIEDSHIDNIDAKTSNAPISAVVLRKGELLSSNYNLSTSNGKIVLELGISEGFEHMVDAHTTMGSIDINLTNLSYAMDRRSIGMQSTAQVKSENFDTASSKIVIKADTSNAPISIKSLA